MLESTKLPDFPIDDALTPYAECASEDSSLGSDTVQVITGRSPRAVLDYFEFESWAWEEEEGQLNGWNE